MRTLLPVAIGAAWLATSSPGVAAERFVPYGGTLNYSNIQAAVTASVAGDIVRVQPGVYRESITFRNVDITLTSMNPADPAVVRNTILEGDGVRSVVSFATGQGSNTLFTGFTVRGGGGTLNSGYKMGGGLYCYQSSPTIIGNIIEANRPSAGETNQFTAGGGVLCWEANPVIARNIIRSNYADIGGGLLSVSGRPRIQDNLIYNNTALSGGAALFSDAGAVLNNTFWNNAPDNLRVERVGYIANNIIGHTGPATAIEVYEDFNSATFQNNDLWVPGGTELLLVKWNGTNYSAVPISLAGTNGNFAADPLFVDPGSLNFQLSTYSPCINAGDLMGLRSTNEFDFHNSPRVYAYRVDVGASEFGGEKNFVPLANAGPDQMVFYRPGLTVTLDASGSIDPEGTTLGFEWIQLKGPPVALLATNALANFMPATLGEYEFGVVASDGLSDSTTDTVRVLVTNLPPIASAGLGRSIPVVPGVLTLDGSHSLDPQGQPLVCFWRQVSGPSTTLTPAGSARPTFVPPGPGAYEFELTVSNLFQASLPERVVFYLGEVPPVANAGPTRYAGRTQISLDGSGSFAPNSSEPLAYAWRQVSGPLATLSPTNGARPALSGFTQKSTVQELFFELVVTADGRSSAPSRVEVVVVPSWNNATLNQVNAPFNPTRPTVVGFAGGNCDTGNAINFPSTWQTRANLFTCSYSRDSSSSVNDPRYFGYGDMLMVVLSAAAPTYSQPIQTMGFSTGNMPACDLAERLNILYRDPRYQVNRITFLDTGCGRNYEANLDNLFANRMPGKMFWVDNYYSVAGSFHQRILNVEFPVPPASHGSPNSWYFPSWNLALPYRESVLNNGVFGGALFSVVAPGKYYQLETGSSEYYFGWAPPKTAVFPLNSLIQLTPAVHPARLLGIMETTGPANGTLVSEGKVVFSGAPVLNAVRYQVLVGAEADRVNQVAWEGATPPAEPLAKLPFARTWWSVKALDKQGTASWTEPRSAIRDTDADGLSDELELRTYLTDPDSPDTDNDLHLDGQEAFAGTDPLRPNFGVQLRFQIVASSELQFTWFTDAGDSYDLESSPTLNPSNWTVVQSFQPSDAKILLHTVPQPSGPAAYFRIRSYR